MSEDSLFEYLHTEIVNYSDNDLSALEYIGYTTGYRLIERLTREWTRFKDELETMKFICTDFWTVIYKKQIDNLRTNHQGVYVLQDNAFRFLTRISSKHLDHAPKVYHKHGCVGNATNAVLIVDIKETLAGARHNRCESVFLMNFLPCSKCSSCCEMD